MAHIVYYDVSKFQGDYVPTGPTACRLSYGTTKDSKFDGIHARATAKRYPFLPYHYLTTGSSAAHQAALVKGWLGPGHSVMLDVENGSGHLSNALNFMDEYKKIGGFVSLVYLPHWYWQNIGSPSLLSLPFRGAGLISSNYTSYSDSGPGWNAYGGVKPSIWQYSDSGNLDHNAFKGSVDELSYMFAHGVVKKPVVPATPGDPTKFSHTLEYAGVPTDVHYDPAAAAWQQQMRTHWHSGVTPDGKFGAYSKAVAISFQKLMKLNPDGVVGPITWNASF